MLLIKVEYTLPRIVGKGVSDFATVVEVPGNLPVDELQGFCEAAVPSDDITGIKFIATGDSK